MRMSWKLGRVAGIDLFLHPTFFILLAFVGATQGGLETVLLVSAVFNLVPAFPMDGGRILRALLSGWLGRAQATRIAAGLGRGLALLFGAYSFCQGHWVQVFLAGFIYLAAGMELAQVLAEERR